MCWLNRMPACHPACPNGPPPAKQIIKALGLDEASKRLTREEAAQRAAALAGQPDLQPPLALPGEVTLQR